MKLAEALIERAEIQKKNSQFLFFEGGFGDLALFIQVSLVWKI